MSDTGTTVSAGRRLWLAFEYLFLFFGVVGGYVHRRHIRVRANGPDDGGTKRP